MPVPGIAFLTPSVVLILGLNVQSRTRSVLANIGSFMAHALVAVDPEVPNWAKEIGEFARNSSLK
ncbi:MAG: hypothetical protein MZV64_02165 [Ignavibacteriales bacterium]|nr:hypothetical protein [Ignavibacteriales bacterium]